MVVMYRAKFLFKIVPIVGSVVGAVVAVLILVASFNKNGPPVILGILWTIFWIVGSYVTLWRTAYSLSVSEGFITWQSPARSGTVRLAEIIRIRPGVSLLNIIECRGQRNILVGNWAGFREFCVALHTECPSITIEYGVGTRLVESLPVPSGFRTEGSNPDLS